MDKIHPSTRPYSRTDNLTLVPPKIKTCIAQSDFSHGRFCLLLLKVHRSQQIPLSTDTAYVLVLSDEHTDLLDFATTQIAQEPFQLERWQLSD